MQSVGLAEDGEERAMIGVIVSEQLIAADCFSIKAVFWNEHCLTTCRYLIVDALPAKTLAQQ